MRSRHCLVRASSASSSSTVWVMPLARAKARWCLGELSVMPLPMSALQGKSRDGVATNGWRRSGLPQGWQCHKNRAGCPKADTQVGISGHLARKADLGIGRRIPRSVFAAPSDAAVRPSRQKKLAQTSGRCARVRITLTAQTHAAEAPQPKEDSRHVWQPTMTATQTPSGHAPATGQTFGRSFP